jgi:extradiol dioxygenase family protein
MLLPADRGGPMLDLIEWVEPKAVFTDPAAVSVTVPTKTIAFATRGVHAAYEALSAKGVRFTCAPATQLEAGIIAVAFCYDPSGNVVELLELASDFQHTEFDAALTQSQ